MFTNLAIKWGPHIVPMWKPPSEASFPSMERADREQVKQSPPYSVQVHDFETYPLVICYIATENGQTIVNFPINNGGSFQFAM